MAGHRFRLLASHVCAPYFRYNIFGDPSIVLTGYLLSLVRVLDKVSAKVCANKSFAIILKVPTLYR